MFETKLNTISFLIILASLALFPRNANALPSGWCEAERQCFVDCRCPEDSPMWGATIFGVRTICLSGPYQECCLTTCSVDGSECAGTLAIICGLLD